MRMMENLSPKNQKLACWIFRLVLRAQQPPSLITLAFAEEGFLDPSSNPAQLRVAYDNEWPQTAVSIQKVLDRQQRRLTECCAGLLVAEADNGATMMVENEQAAQRVVFAHQTAKEWVAREDIWHKITDLPAVDNVQLDLSILSGCVRHLKAFDVFTSPVSVWPNPRFGSDAWLLIANALRCAERIDNEEGFDFIADYYYELLDELDRSCQQAWVTALQTQRPMYEPPEWYESTLQTLLAKHWAGFEPMEAGKPPKRKNFLALAVQANLVRYVAAKLNRLDPASRKVEAQDLLPHVVGPIADGFSACVSLSGDYLDFHHDMPDTRLLDILFDAGASCRPDPDANDNEDASYVLWTKAIKTGRRYFSRGSPTMTHLLESGSSRRLMLNRQRWVTAIKALLLHGADPRVEIEAGAGGGTSVGNSEVGESQSSIGNMAVTAGDFIREMLAGEPEYGIELFELETLMGYNRGRAQ